MASLNPNLVDFWFKDGKPAEENFIRCRHRVLYGGRASSKSYEFAGMAASIAQQYQTRFLCVRRYQNKIKESVYTLIRDQIERFNMPGFNVLATTIEHANGSEFVFYGIERNTDEIKSFEGADILWIEEAHNLTKEQWQILKPTIRKQGSEIWISFNPKLVTDFVYQRFIVNPPANTRVRLVNYLENPFLSDTALADIEDLKAEDYEEYEHIYLGVPRTDDDSAVIKRSWITAAIDAHKTLGIEPSGAKRLGYDVADDGDDKNAYVSAHGFLAMESKEWGGRTDDLLGSCSLVYGAAREMMGQIIYDSIGVGAGAGSKFKELNESGPKYVKYQSFNAGGKVHKPDSEYQPGVTNQEFFSNLKAQAWWLAADRFRNTYNAITKGQQYPEDKLISISGDMDNLERLIDELSTPKRDFDANGKVKVESKKDLIKRGVKSPNLADAFIMAYSPTIEMVDYRQLL